MIWWPEEQGIGIGAILRLGFVDLAACVCDLCDFV